MTYEKGDKILLKCFKALEFGAIEDMVKFGNTIMTINSSYGCGYDYRMLEDNGMWHWNEHIINTTIETIPVIQALRASIKHWRENKGKIECMLAEGETSVEVMKEQLFYRSDSCALCSMFLHSNDRSCEKCPLSKIGDRCSIGVENSWSIFVFSKTSAELLTNAQGMIDALDKALVMEIENIVNERKKATRETLDDTSKKVFGKMVECCPECGSSLFPPQPKHIPKTYKIGDVLRTKSNTEIMLVTNYKGNLLYLHDRMVWGRSETKIADTSVITKAEIELAVAEYVLETDADGDFVVCDEEGKERK